MKAPCFQMMDAGFWTQGEIMFSMHPERRVQHTKERAQGISINDD